MNIELPKKIKGAILITFGDGDSDGGQGVQAKVYADVPLDGVDGLRELLSTPELEVKDAASAVAGFLPALVGAVTGLARR